LSCIKLIIILLHKVAITQHQTIANLQLGTKHFRDSSIINHKKVSCKTNLNLKLELKITINLKKSIDALADVDNLIATFIKV